MSESNGFVPRRQCTICNSDKETVIHAMLAAGRTPNYVENEMRRMGVPIKAETIRRHIDGCLQGQISNAALVTAVSDPRAPLSPNADFALAIRNEANRLLANGQLQVTAHHGLKAQELLDRRAEKQADRQLMVELAGLLAGAHARAPADLIEGEWQEVEVERLASG